MIVWTIIVICLMFILAMVCQRAAYRNGVCDGYQCFLRPGDPLWDENGVNEILVSRGQKKGTQ